MSDYRDDSTDTVTASGVVLSGLTSIVESAALAVSSVLFGVLVSHADIATASDVVTDSSAYLVTASAQAEDDVLETNTASDTTVEALQANDLLTINALQVLHDEAIIITDGIVDLQGGITTESAAASDSVSAARTSYAVVVDTLTVRDAAYQSATEAVDDLVSVSDEVRQASRMTSVLSDSVVIADTIESAGAAPNLSSSLAVVADAVLDQMHAATRIDDDAIVLDAVIEPGMEIRQTWTANVDTWAMSRYTEFPFDQLAVIDGHLYGTNSIGVFQLTGTDPGEIIEATIQTGKLDLSGGLLTHPTSAYLEYELSGGTASMGVTTTQSGTSQHFEYPLAQEVANELTNGRFIFGRGLRGRHFTFTLNINAKRAHINDLSIAIAPTKRRV